MMSAVKQYEPDLGGIWSWTRDLLICSQMLYHWAIPPPPHEWSQYYCLCCVCSQRLTSVSERSHQNAVKAVQLGMELQEERSRRRQLERSVKEAVIILRHVLTVKSQPWPGAASVPAAASDRLKWNLADSRLWNIVISVGAIFQGEKMILVLIQDSQTSHLPSAAQTNIQWWKKYWDPLMRIFSKSKTIQQWQILHYK